MTKPEYAFINDRDGVTVLVKGKKVGTIMQHRGMDFYYQEASFTAKPGKVHPTVDDVKRELTQ